MGSPTNDLPPGKAPSISRLLVNVPRRFRLAASYCAPTLRTLLGWIFSSREVTNFTYDLTPLNMSYLAAAVATATGHALDEIERYVSEPIGDRELVEHVRRETAASAHRYAADDRPRFGRRLGWYAVVRALKPEVVVETGVDKGLGALLLCSALRRNAAEGHGGRYYGTDIDPQAGFLLAPPYDAFGKILLGDSLTSLSAFGETIGVFINDSDHSADYEYREYLAVRDRLAPGAILLGDNAHVTDSLLRFARQTGRSFLFFREEPKDHWYPGAGIGFAYEARR
jgi:predicted O-methyltransferase YrrM